MPRHLLTSVSTAFAAASILALLTSCSAPAPDLEEPTVADEALVADQAQDTRSAPSSAPCELADITPVATPALLELYDDEGYSELTGSLSVDDTRCKVPADTEILNWYGAHGFQVDGIATLSNSSWFYLAMNDYCLIEVAYFADENNYSPNKTDYPEKLRFATATEALDAGYAARQERCAG